MRPGKTQRRLAGADNRGRAMENSIHHIHIFASDIEKSIKFYKELFGGVVMLNMDIAGTRNVFMQIGSGRIHFYERPPKDSGRGAMHHFGIQTDDIDSLVTKMKSRGMTLKKEITDFGFWKYIMIEGPDSVLIELFQVDKNRVPAEYADYFG